MSRVVIEGGAVVTMDGGTSAGDAAGYGTEYAEGHVVVEDDRIVAVGPGSAPEQDVPVHRIDATGCVVTPGLVNTHHHLYQWATRGYAVDSDLFGWLTALYPVWAGIDEEITHAAASSGLAWMALSGCTTAADHHYVFPRDGGDVFGGVVAAGERVGIRLHAVRGSMDRGRSQGGLPPDSLVEDLDEALAGTDAAIDRFHDPSPGSRVRVAVGPCSPFSVSSELMRQAAELARRRGARLHTHLAETVDEEEQCRAEFGCSPAEYAEQLGWLGQDVWLAHTIHLSDKAIARFGETGTGSAHCPSSNGRVGAGVAPVRPLLDARVPVGLGVDGVASNEAGGLGHEMRQALLTARAHYGPTAISVRDALWMATRGGAKCLGRDAELGALTAGRLADIAVWRIDGLGHAGIEDPVAALVLGPLPKLERLLCGGDPVVHDGHLTRTFESDLTHELRRASARIRHEEALR
ncbi:cytosine/adenosine deaminase-related metal-dependent hydrolase [Saccharopolyspora erythraea NRRL 2338]|uniref:Hydroxydechloroatrazine ethylaminohydrolase n=2 Tax=Saccharopolyspora erythraea TaxID=1836 RepID=A4F962_SACEN|nr:8-oxoguanine deaminase [Saccharopolyspora erythraea]EQD87171.1 hydroxydechloroatrazine ethylaminohydrolase [Saccharopolyspora erythraea D]PFG94379.1 cytosine/adenosine deaminase-related metal-dependent hydrolase [Saccharopolyspora erythraea NRRL 2338]QRK91147.1 8-oxoguanine deaminase [Saccharopolyspora erythraea]CAM00587.1 hydroxydechloroatrazine ethylaminohydrolase [Saccharopolyspora erythraea NRRL 2338]